MTAQTNRDNVDRVQHMSEHRTLRFSWRDRFVAFACNVLLNHVASRDYRAMIGGSIRYGLLAAARDTQRERSSEASSL